MKKIILLLLTISLFSCNKEPITPNTSNTGSVVSKEIIDADVDGNNDLYKISIKNDITGGIFDYYLSYQEMSYITPTYNFSGVQTGFYNDRNSYWDIPFSQSVATFQYSQNSGLLDNTSMGGGDLDGDGVDNSGGITITFNVINSSHRSAVDPVTTIVGCISNEDLYNSINIGDKQNVYKIPYNCNGSYNTVNNFCSTSYFW